MQEKYDRNKVALSFRKFNDFASDVLSSVYNTFNSNLRIFIDHCENDEIMSIISNQLKRDSNIFDEWWSENDLSGLLSQVGSKEFNLPINENKRDALLFQICLKINNKEVDLLSFCINFTNCNPDGSVSFFNRVIMNRMVRSINYRLNAIISESITEQNNKQDIPVQQLYVYQDFSTIVNGDVNTKGDAAIGEGAKIEKKSLI